MCDGAGVYGFNMRVCACVDAACYLHHNVA